MVMKLSKIASLTLSMLVFLSQNCLAAPCYGPRMPAKNRWILGYESDFIFKRKLADNYGTMRSFQHFFTMSVGIFDWLSLDGKLGIGDVKTWAGDYPAVKYDYGFSGAYGFRIKVLDDQKHGLTGILGFQHISVHPPGKNIDDNKNQCIVDDWQASVLISKKIKDFGPYLGLKVSECDLIHRLNETGRKRRKSELAPGLFVGADYYIKDRIKLNIEARFLDETAVSGGASYIF